MNQSLPAVLNKVQRGFHPHSSRFTIVPGWCGGRANVAQIARQFQTPVVCEAGRQFAVILRMPVGTATASQIVQGSVSIDGYFE